MGKTRVLNGKKQPITVVLEPWALEWVLIPQDYLDFTSVSEGSELGWFIIEDHNYGLVVFPEGHFTQIYVYDSKGLILWQD